MIEAGAVGMRPASVLQHEVLKIDCKYKQFS